VAKTGLTSGDAPPGASPEDVASERTSSGSRHLALDARRLSKAYPGVQALDDVSFTLERGEVLGLVGENGAGKSTFLSIVNGSVRPDAGTLWIEGEEARFGKPAESAQRGIATVYQEQGLVPTLNVTENMFLGRESRFESGGFLRSRPMVAAAQAILDQLEIEISPTALVARLTFGERQLVEIAKAFALTAAFDVRPIILLDEPTSALSERETERLLANVRQWRDRASFIFVSHRLAHVFVVSDRIAALKDGRLIAQLGADEIDEPGLHELIVGRKRDVEYYKEARQRTPAPEVMLSVRDASKRGAFSDVSFDVRSGEIVGIAGVAGCGKEALARAVIGVERLEEGQVVLCGSNIPSSALAQAIRRGAAYIPADRHREGIIGDHTILWNMTLPLLDQLRGRGPLISERASRLLVREWIDKLNIKVRGPEAIAKTLSGGNQQKVIFAKWLAKGVKVLVLDDPGRGLDVGAKEAIYALLRDLADEGVAILLVSDNLPELIGLSNRIMVMRGGQVTGELAADLDAKPTESEVVRYMV
jgi:ribose transport system ATP-binding protein